VPDLCRLARGGEEAQAPVLQQRTKLFEIPSSEVWTHKIMRLNERYFAFAATTEDIVCEKYMQPDCTGAYVEAFRVANGTARCETSVKTPLGDVSD
jgi:hypothetical protein